MKIKRIYEQPDPNDGLRVLVDRLWPRGISKDEAKIDLWLKEVAPSDKLRKWYGHDPTKWLDFVKKYKTELVHSEALLRLKALAKKESRITLVFAAKDTRHSNAMVLNDLLKSERG